jgi:large subunit ribosomal protein L25
MEKVILNAALRETKGKEASNRLRKEGFLPSVVYKKGKKTQTLAVNSKELSRLLHTSAGGNVIITLNIKEDKGKTVIIKEIQYDPIKGDMIHVDFHEISLTEKIAINIPIEPKGIPAGVKNDGGILDQPLKELRIECLPTEIPKNIEVHVEGLKIGDAIRVKDLVIPANIKVLHDAELTVLSVVPPKIEKPAAEVAPEEAITEPEVIREKKPTAEEAAEEEKPKEEKPKEKEEKK